MKAKPSRAVLALIFASGLCASLSAAAGGATNHDQGAAARNYDVAQASAAPAASAASQPANAVRPEFATPFNAAQALIKGGNAQGALDKLKEADALPNKTPYEQYLITRVRAPSEYAAGDLPSAVTDFQSVLASPLLPAEDREVFIKALAQILYTAANYPQAAIYIKQYLDGGGQDAQLRELLPQTLYLAKDYPNAAKMFQSQIDATYAAGQKPPEKTLRLLASAQSQSNDDAGYVTTLEHLAIDYPKPDYFKDLISRVSRGDKFSDRLYVDTYRLKADALGAVADNERLSYASLAMHAGYPGEAQRVLDEGLAKKAFTGADLGEATKLQAQAAKGAAQDRAQAAASETAAKNGKDGNALAGFGLLVTVNGDPASGASLLEQGIAKGGLKAPDEAMLHLGMAQLRAGRNADAVKTFKSITAGGGIGSLAHSWSVVAQSRVEAAAPHPIAGAAAASAAQ